MVLTKDGQTISLDNSDHINAFLGSGWAEAKASAPAPKAEKVEEPKAEEVKVAEKKAVSKKKQEK